MQIRKLGWKYFIKLCSTWQDEKHIEQLFDLLFTPEEKENLSMRSLIIKELLKQGKTQRQMAEDLEVSIAKITRGSNELKRMRPEFIAELSKIIID